MSAHTPGRQCAECEGFCLAAPSGEAVLSLHIGQRVRHRDYDGTRVTGTVRVLAIEDRALMATIALDRPIVIPARDEHQEISIWTQHVPAHELAVFDDRGEALAELLAVAERCERRLAGEKWRTDGPREAMAPESQLLCDLRSAISKAKGGAA